MPPFARAGATVEVMIVYLIFTPILSAKIRVLDRTKRIAWSVIEPIGAKSERTGIEDANALDLSKTLSADVSC